MAVKTRKAHEGDFTVTGSKGVTYHVTLFRDGSAYCTCPACPFRSNRKEGPR